MTRIKLTTLLAAIIALTACTDTTKVGLLDMGTNTSQIDEMASIISSQNGMDCSVIEAADLNSAGRYDVIWYHRPDSSAISKEETALGDTFKKYVENGGKLILSNEAVRLLNEWGIENTQVSVFHYDAIDDGFGRKAGFRGFRSHPIFKDMHGGSYVWHGHEDNTCRILGFPENALPAAAGAKILGTFWEYIFYHPEEKVIWETPLGKGSILAIGGLLNYGMPNFNKALLDKFTTNCIEYIAGKVNDGEEEYCWIYPEATDIIEDSYNYKEVKAAGPARWNIGEDRHALKWEATLNEVNIASARSMVVCKENGGIFEIWTHPFMSLRDYNVLVRKGEILQPLSNVGTKIELRANSLIRTFKIEGGVIKEIITASVDSPAVIAHYEWTEGAVDEIIVDFKSNLRYMWPYEEDALGSLHYGWDNGLNAFFASDENREFVSAVGFNVPANLLAAGRYDGYTYEGNAPAGKETPLLQVNASVSLNINGTNSCDVFFVAGNEGDKSVVNDYCKALEKPFDVFKNSEEFHEAYFAEHTTVVAPDPVFNEGYYWALTSAAQMRVDVPGMGKGLFAGYSSSRRGWGGGQRVSGRPGYAWFFGRDSEWTSLAFLDWGDMDLARNVLDMLIKYQRVDGKIYHEATSNGSIHYDASDSTPFFVVLMARYLKSTGDIDYVKKNIEAVHKALAYCESTDTNGDRLLENVNVGHGWLEGGDFYGSRTEFVIATLHCRALYEASGMCRILGDSQHAEAYEAYANELKTIINNDFWNAEEGYFNYGKKMDDSFTDNLLALVSSCVYFGDTEYDKSRKTMRRFNDLHMRRDWGQKSVADTCELSYLGAYTENNIWPLFTGTTALSEYEYGLYNQGFEHTMQNMLEYLSDSHGRVPEVLSGEMHKSNGITRNQGWSETMAIQPVIEGMLGFRPDAVNYSVELRPRIPLMWNSLDAKNLKVGTGSLNMSMTKGKGSVAYRLESDGKLNVHMAPSYGLGTTVNSVTVNGEDKEFSVCQEAEYSTVEFCFKLDRAAEVIVSISEKNAALPHYHLAERNEEPRGAIIKSQIRKGDDLVLELQGHKGKSDTIAIYAPQGVTSVEGAASFNMLDGDTCNITVDFDGEDEKYITKTIIIHP